MATETGKKEYQELLQRTENYAEQVRKLLANAVNDILAFTTSVPHLEERSSAHKRGKRLWPESRRPGGLESHRASGADPLRRLF